MDLGIIAARTLHIVRHVAGALLLLMATLLAATLFKFGSQAPSYFYYVEASDVSWAAYYGATVAAATRLAFGVCSWFLVVLTGYAGLLLLSVLSPKREWDRFIASFALLITVPTIIALWSSAFPSYQAGLLGNELVAYARSIADSSVLAVIAWSVTFACLVVITRMELLLLVYKACTFLHERRAIQRTGYAIQWTSLAVYHACEAAVLWSWYLVRGRIVEKHPELNDYEPMEHEEPSFSEIAEDTFWKSYDGTVPHEEHEQDQLQGEAFQDVPQTHDYLEYTTEIQANTHAESHSDDEYEYDMGEAEVAEREPEPIKVQQTYRLPDLSIFTAIPIVQRNQDEQDSLRARAGVLEQKLEKFGIKGKVVSIEHGPVITLFEYKPNIDMKVSKILALEDDLALALQATSIRIIAPVPGKPVVGFEVANINRRDVLVSQIVHSSDFREFKGDLPLILGSDTIGNNVIIDLLKSPHLLVAGSTGSGKSVALNTMLVSLLCSKSPDELRLILIDPKRLEFATFADLPHLLFPIVVQPNKAVEVLKWVVHTMEERYDHMAASGVRNILDYYEKFGDAGKKEMPFIVVVIDELADLMMTTGKQIEDLIARIAQMARAAGIHMILATQRPSVDVITGLIKVNFPSRISFRVTSKVDSRTILDAMGAEKLLGRGDMLYMDSHGTSLVRAHGAYVSDDEIAAVVAHVRNERDPQYLDLTQFESPASAGSNLMEGDDSLYGEVLDYLNEVDEVSISLLQRKFRIGYNRSARIIELLEGEGRIISLEGGKMRKVVRQEGS